MNLFFLVLKQTQKKLDQWRTVADQPMPAVGWIKTKRIIRNTYRRYFEEANTTFLG